MRSERIRIEFASAEGAVVRLLGLVERRGFIVHGIDMAAENAGAARMTLDVAPRDAGRSLDVLALQIQRLHGITAVSAFPFPMASAA